MELTGSLGGIRNVSVYGRGGFVGYILYGHGGFGGLGLAGWLDGWGMDMWSLDGYYGWGRGRGGGGGGGDQVGWIEMRLRWR